MPKTNGGGGDTHTMVECWPKHGNESCPFLCTTFHNCDIFEMCLVHHYCMKRGHGSIFISHHWEGVSPSFDSKHLENFEKATTE